MGFSCRAIAAWEFFLLIGVVYPEYSIVLVVPTSSPTGSQVRNAHVLFCIASRGGRAAFVSHEWVGNMDYIQDGGAF